MAPFFFLAQKLAHERLMARSSEARPKVIKIPILIEAAAGDNNSGRLQSSCQNWPPGGHQPSSPTSAAGQTGGREGATSASTRIIPILLPAESGLRSSDRRPEESGETYSRKVEVAQKPGTTKDEPREAGGLGGLRARMGTAEQRQPPGATPTLAASSGAQQPPSDMAETLVTSSTTSASDIR
jgi:hypothetical protein